MKRSGASKLTTSVPENGKWEAVSWYEAQTGQPQKVVVSPASLRRPSPCLVKGKEGPGLLGPSLPSIVASGQALTSPATEKVRDTPHTQGREHIPQQASSHCGKEKDIGCVVRETQSMKPEQRI